MEPCRASVILLAVIAFAATGPALTEGCSISGLNGCLRPLNYYRGTKSGFCYLVSRATQCLRGQLSSCPLNFELSVWQGWEPVMAFCNQGPTCTRGQLNSCLWPVERYLNSGGRSKNTLCSLVWNATQRLKRVLRNCSPAVGQGTWNNWKKFMGFCGIRYSYSP